MRNVLLSTFFVLTTFTLQAQNIEVFGGSLKNRVKVNTDNRGRYSTSNQSSHNGYSFGIGINNLVHDSFPKLRFRFTLRYDQYGNYIYTNDEGRQGYNRDEVITQKSNISLGFYPVNFKVLKNLHLGLGFEFGLLLKAKTEGYNYGYHSNYGNPIPQAIKTTSPLNNSIHYKKIVPGLVGRVGYKIPITKRFTTLPQADYYYGLQEEYENLVLMTHSRRWSLKLGLEYKL